MFGEPKTPTCEPVTSQKVTPRNYYAPFLSSLFGAAEDKNSSPVPKERIDSSCSRMGEPAVMMTCKEVWLPNDDGIQEPFSGLILMWICPENLEDSCDLYIQSKEDAGKEFKEKKFFRTANFTGLANSPCKFSQVSDTEYKFQGLMDMWDNESKGYVEVNEVVNLRFKNLLEAECLLVQIKLYISKGRMPELEKPVETTTSFTEEGDGKDAEDLDTLMDD